VIFDEMIRTNTWNLATNFDELNERYDQYRDSV